MDVKQHLKKMVSSSELRNCVKVEVAVLGSLSRTVRTVPVDCKQYLKKMVSRGELRSRVKVEIVAVLGSPSLIVLNMVSVDVTQQLKKIV